MVVCVFGRRYTLPINFLLITSCIYGPLFYLLGRIFYYLVGSIILILIVNVNEFASFGL